MKITSAIDWFMLPNIAFVIFVLFLLIYLIFLDEEGAFTKKFLHFGPGTDEKDMPTFLGMKLDSWRKVIIVYIMTFVAALLQSYYQNVVGLGMHAYIWNPQIKLVPFSKFWTYAIVNLEPFIYFFLNIIRFFTTLTMQLQFMIPNFIGTYIAEVPFAVRWLNKKKFSEQ